MTDNDRVLYMIRNRIEKELNRLQGLERGELNETKIVSGYNNAGGYATKYVQLEELEDIVKDITEMME